MTAKRFENRLNKDNVKFNTLNPVWDNEKEDALNVFEMIDLLNELNDECEFLKIDNEALEDANKSINLNPNYSYSYVIRGMIKTQIK